MKLPVVDVKPGQIFLANWGLDNKPQFYLKLRDQKAVNLGTYTAFSPRDQQEEVEVKEHPIDSYLFVGGLHE